MIGHLLNVIIVNNFATTLLTLVKNVVNQIEDKIKENFSPKEGQNVLEIAYRAIHKNVKIWSKKKDKTKN